MSSDMFSTHTEVGGDSGALEAAFRSRFLRFGEFHVDLKREELFRDGMRIRMAGKVFRTLVTLMEQPGEIVSRDALRLRLWPEGTHVNYDANVNTTVNKLRQVLGDCPEKPKYVETIPRQGYSFVAKVEGVEQIAATSDVPADPEQAQHNSVVRKEALQNWVFGAALTPRWVKAGAIALILAGMMFGAAVALYVHHGL